MGKGNCTVIEDADLTASLDVTVRVRSSWEELPGTVRTWTHIGPNTLTWVPDAPLPAVATLSVSVSTNNQRDFGTRCPSVHRDVSGSWEIMTTGSEVSGPLDDVPVIEHLWGGMCDPAYLYMSFRVESQYLDFRLPETGTATEVRNMFFKRFAVEAEPTDASDLCVDVEAVDTGTGETAIMTLCPPDDLAAKFDADGGDLEGYCHRWGGCSSSDTRSPWLPAIFIVLLALRPRARG